METGKRPTITARERGPGPGRYGLPTCLGYIDHDPTKHMKPAHTFGLKLHGHESNVGPGPAHCVEANMTRTGKDGAPQYSMAPRPHEISSFQVPGPGTYCPEKHANPYEETPPQFSMGARTRFRKRDSNPAPNSYMTPKVFGPNLVDMPSNPAYSMVRRDLRGSYLQDLAKTPGPCKYKSTCTNVYKERKPVYSMLARTEPPGDKSLKPGPGDHYPELVDVSHPTQPKFSMGIRHSEYITPLIVDVPDVDE